MAGSKAARRARKKERRALAPIKHAPLHCDGCGRHVRDVDGNHNSPWSVNHVTVDGLAIVAWCPNCGADSCS